MAEGALTDAELGRFRAKFTKIGQCFIWTGAPDRDGYGSFWFRGANRRAHRMAWYIQNGEIPDGMVVNHTCRNRACVNHQHLQVVTPRENVLSDSSSLSYINSQKRTCPEGHPYDRVETNGSGRKARVCSVCRLAKRRASKRAAYHRAKAAVRI